MNWFKKKIYVGPLLYRIYDSMDWNKKTAFKDFVSGVSPKREMIATIPSITGRVAQTILSQLQDVPTGKNSRKGAVGSGDGYIFYISGDFPDSVLYDLANLFNDFAISAKVTPTILQGSPSTDQLKELP